MEDSMTAPEDRYAAVRRMIHAEIGDAIDVEIKNAAKEMVEEQRKAIQEGIEEHKLAIRQLIEEEKAVIRERVKELTQSVS